jgi:hypothetical protein
MAVSTKEKVIPVEIPLLRPQPRLMILEMIFV